MGARIEARIQGMGEVVLLRLFSLKQGSMVEHF